MALSLSLRLACVALLMDGSAGLSLTLKYFDARGAAEISRVLLALGSSTPGEAIYEDVRYPIGPGFQSEAFKEDKESGALMMNLNRAPLLVIDGEGVLFATFVKGFIGEHSYFQDAYKPDSLRAMLADSSVWSLLQQRQQALCALERGVVPATDITPARDIYPSDEGDHHAEPEQGGQRDHRLRPP